MGESEGGGEGWERVRGGGEERGEGRAGGRNEENGVMNRQSERERERGGREIQRGN